MLVSTPSLTLSTQRTTLMASCFIWTLAPEEGADLSASREREDLSVRPSAASEAPEAGSWIV